MPRLLFDTESDGFVSNATKIHCIGTIDADTGETKGYGPDQLDAALEALASADMLIGHNIQRHDLPLLKKLLGFHPKPGVLIRDTMVLARLIFPNVKATDDQLILAGKMPAGNKYKGKHTIAAWGYRLGNPKGDYAAIREVAAKEKGLEHPGDIAKFVWGTWSQEMQDYMLQDCSTNFDLWKHLRPDEYSQNAVELEHRVARAVDTMETNGFPFDLRAAGGLQARLVERKHVLEQKLKETFGSWWAPISPDPTKSIFIPKKDNKRLGYLEGYPIKKYKLVSFNPGSRDHIAKVLKDKGWQPTKLTEGGKPQIDEEVIESIVARYPEMDGIGELMMIEKRLSQLCGTDNSLMASVKDDGRIHGVINPMGTITSRAAHMFPNLGQVPSPKKPYGMDFRKLFTVDKPGWVFVGADQQGLELRGLAHYLAPMDRGKYGEIVCDGDPHWKTATAMGLITGERDENNQLHTIIREDGAKRFAYAVIYGCYDLMAGQIVYECLLNALRNGGEEGVALYRKFFGEGVVEEKLLKKVGRKVRLAFASGIEGFDKLQARIAGQVEKRGRVPGLDGRIIPVRSEHSALNFLIQSAGAIICKRWLADAFDECCAKFKLGWDGDFVFSWWVHDEIGVACRSDIAAQIGEILERNARTAGTHYGLRIRLDSKASQGPSWGDVH